MGMNRKNVIKVRPFIHHFYQIPGFASFCIIYILLQKKEILFDTCLGECLYLMWCLQTLRKWSFLYC